MADVWVGDGTLQIDLSVPERVLSLHKGQVSVPLSEVRAVRVVRDVLSHVRGLKRPGANFPGVLAIGTWRGTERGQAFLDFVVVHQPGPGVIISTQGEYDRIVVGTDEPEKFAAEFGVL